MTVRCKAHARNDLAPLGQRRVHAKLVIVAVQIVNVLSDDFALEILPRTIANAVTRIDGRLSVGSLGAQIGAPGFYSRAMTLRQLLTILVGTFKANTWVAFLAATSLILGAAYALWLYRKVIFGELTKDSLKSMLDMSPREVAVFLPLVLITLWMGIYPNSFLDPMAPSIDKLIGDYNAALKLARTAALP